MTTETNNNVLAFLTVIRQCEGTDAADGYNYLFGSSPRNTLRFTDFSTHPNIARPFGANSHSTAAGAYQILHGTWLDLCGKLGVSDFMPETQDAMCVELLKENGAYPLLITGDLDGAVNKANRTWASLPNSPYGQPTHTIAQVTAWFNAALASQTTQSV